ncbi:Gibberellin receptor GID1B [Spatholobus suberectus]|nr:Gibberellin receptor GID1B [Spatholobus suberectus]
MAGLHFKWVISRTWLQNGKDFRVHVYLARYSSGGNVAHHVAVKATEVDIEVLGNILLYPLFGVKESQRSQGKN